MTNLQSLRSCLCVELLYRLKLAAGIPMRAAKSTLLFNYKCLKTQHYQDNAGYSIEPIRQQDMESIRQWRNEQMHVLRQQQPLSKEHQEQYFNDVLKPSFSQKAPQQILFSFFLNGELIGYGGLTYIDWISKRTELSFLLETSRNKSSDEFKKHFSHFLKLMFKAAFQDLQLHRLFTETYHYRTDVIEVLEQNGLRLEGRLREHMLKGSQWADSVIHGILADEVIFS